jgi:cell division protein FtsW
MSKEQKSYIISILIFTYFLVIFGVVMNFGISSASQSGSPSLSLFYRYLAAIAGGSLVMFIFAIVNHKVLSKIALPVLVLLFILLFFTKSSLPTNSRRWIPTGTPFAFQPSQYVSLFLIIFTAKIFSGKVKEENMPKYYIFLLVIMLLFVGKIAIEPDLGTAFIIFLTMILLLYTTGMNLTLFSSFIFFVSLVGYIFIKHNEGWHKRILAYLHPEKFALESGYQAVQAFRAIAHGGIAGVGLTKSFFKYGGLPEGGVDFIFAIIGEELGLIGETAIILLFALLGYLGLRISNRVADPYSRILALGITISIVVGAVVNISTNIGLLPVTGVPLPIVSYSGNNIIPTFASIGILINIVKEEVR